MKQETEYKAPKSNKCINCYFYEFENVYRSNRGKCTKKFSNCERIKQ